MSRPARFATPMTSRERLLHDSMRSAPLRQIYPQLSEVRVEFEFQDGTTRTPSPQSFSHFPAARGFFRYACPSHSCNGEFDLSEQVAELASNAEGSQRTRRMSVACTGQRAHDATRHVDCPICARVRVSTILRETE
jgi:hypothetical protein